MPIYLAFHFYGVGIISLLFFNKNIVMNTKCPPNLLKKFSKCFMKLCNNQLPLKQCEGIFFQV